MSFLSVPFQASIATAFSNLDSSRPNQESSLFSSLEQRKVGWTEVWGTSEVSDAWTHEEEEPSTSFAQVEISIFQYRPAWFEQLVLRLADIPFVVYNSPYGATESTGPLPFLRDLRLKHPPVLVGRKQSSGDRSTFDSSIVDYLLDTRQIESTLLGKSKDENTMFQLYAILVTTKLNPALLVLRYDDDDAWRQVHRRQCLSAASAKQSWVLSSWFSAWSEHTVSQHLLGPFRSTVPQALTEARRCYELFDAQLSAHQYILGGSKPTIVDALLFDHLANALCNVHLVGILLDFPNLAKFFDNLYNHYFANGDDDWMLWNRAQNESNAFLQFPLERMHSSKFKDSLELIHELIHALSTRQGDVSSVLSAAKEKQQQSSNDNAANNADVKWHKLSSTDNTWRNGVVMVTVGVVTLAMLRTRSH